MANDNKTVQLELVKAILEELPFGILVTKNEKEIVLYNRILKLFQFKFEKNLRIS